MLRWKCESTARLQYCEATQPARGGNAEVGRQARQAPVALSTERQIENNRGWLCTNHTRVFLDSAVSRCHNTYQIGLGATQPPDMQATEKVHQANCESAPTQFLCATWRANLPRRSVTAAGH